jgi:hypothetical protein
MAEYASPTRKRDVAPDSHPPSRAGVVPHRPRHAPAAAQALWDTAQRLNAQRPLTLQKASAALSDRSVRESQAAGPIQLYAIVNGAKVSENEQLCLVDTQELYAGDDQFAEANEIPGMVRFAAGAQIGEGFVAPDRATNLHRVTATLRPDAESPPFYRTDAAGAVASPTTQDIDENTQYLNEHRQSRDAFNADNNQQYEQAQIDRDGPLLPSNCDEASVFVTGLTNPEADPDSAPRPGHRHVHSPGGTDADEWAFHYAGIIMADGGDHVTMENAGAKASENFSKRLMDKTWFYKMYGTAHEQSFATEYGADLPGGAVSIQRPGPVVADIEDAVHDEPVDDHAALLGQAPQQPEGLSMMGAIGACLRGLGSCLPGWGGDAD